MRNRIALTLELCPALIFAALLLRYGPGGTDWRTVYFAAGGAGAMATAAAFLLRTRPDGILLGVNGYFLLGAAAFGLKQYDLLGLFMQLRGAAVMGCVALVAATQFALPCRRGPEVDAPGIDKAHLCTTLIAINLVYVSYLLRGSVMLSVVLPILGLFAVRRLLRSALPHATTAKDAA